MHLTTVSIAVICYSAFAACGGVPHEGIAPAEWASVGRWCWRYSPATSLPTAMAESLAVDSDSSSEDARWARIARVVPGGWGGGLFLADGVPTIYLTDTSRRSEALMALNQRAVDGRTLGADVRVRQGRWSFAQLYDWYRYLNQRIGDVSISGTDIDQANNRLLYSVTSETAKRALEARLSTLAIPCYLVAVEIRPFSTLTSTTRGTLKSPSVEVQRGQALDDPPSVGEGAVDCYAGESFRGWQRWEWRES